MIILTTNIYEQIHELQKSHSYNKKTTTKKGRYTQEGTKCI